MGLTVYTSQLTFLPSSKSCDTETRTNIKTSGPIKFRYYALVKKPWSVASYHCKWRRR